MDDVYECMYHPCMYTVGAPITGQLRKIANLIHMHTC
jgi:hypothetical protein